MAPGESRRNITGDLSFARVDIAGIAPDAATSKPPAPQPGAESAWIDRPLPLTGWRAFDADLTVKAGTPADVGASLSKQLPLDALHVLDGVLHLKADHVRIGDFGVDDGILDTILDAGYLQLSLKAGQERLAADVELKPEKTQWRLNLKHKGKLDLSWLIEEENAAALSHLPAALDVRLSGVGNSLEALRAYVVTGSRAPAPPPPPRHPGSGGR